MKILNTNILKEQVSEITDKLLKGFISQKVLVILENKEFIGTLTAFRGKYAICENDKVLRSFSTEDIQKITGKNKFKNLFESIVRCGDNKYCVKSKKGKNLGGPYSLKGAKERLREVEYFKHLSETSNPILKETLKNKFFIQEEIVNKDHKGRMTKGMQASRDKTASKLKNVKVVKGPPGRDDTPEEAKYRLATYLEWKKRKAGE